jgi:hypothetical protein
MSTALGIASVTQVLKDLLNDGLIRHDIGGTINSQVSVSSLAPSLIENDKKVTDTQLNLFLYRVSPNSGWHNIGYPSRNSAGEIINNPPLALNLHYMLTAFGDSELHSEVLLGFGMQLFHETPILDRAAIQYSLTVAKSGVTGTLPEDFEALAHSELAQQIEQIKITPEYLNNEELSKLWTAFQAKYRPCTAYKISVVLIDSKKPVLSPLPVKTRVFHTFPFKHPVIESIHSSHAEDSEVLVNEKILIGHYLVIKGTQLNKKHLAVLINGNSFSPSEHLVSDDMIRLELQNPLQAGIQGVQVVHYMPIRDPVQLRPSAESNLQAFVLSPKLDIVEVVTGSIKGTATLSADIKIEVDPQIQPNQRIRLLFNQFPSPAVNKPAFYSFEYGPNISSATKSLTIPIHGVNPGNYLVRIQVDGAESPLDSNTEGVYTGPKLNLP